MQIATASIMPSQIDSNMWPGTYSDTCAQNFLTHVMFGSCCQTFLLSAAQPKPIAHFYMQAIPAVACFTAMVWGLQLFYSIASPQGLQVVRWSPQATVLILVLIGSGACVSTCLAVPRVQRLKCWRGPTKMPLKRMNLLGLVRHAALPCLLISLC